MSNERTPYVPAIRVRDVRKQFGDVTALAGVSFDVAPGELFFLLGPSGCGKTTMLRILAGLETMDAGTVEFNGQDTRSLPPHRRGAPMVFQNYALWPHLRVAENVSFGLVEQKRPRQEIATRVAATLQQVGLSGMGNRLPGELSGGQQQRVVLARALVLNPGVILLDEPLSNLDAKLRAEMREEIEALHRETGITFMYVTHDQAEALSLADRMAVMNEGRIEAIGTPLDLYRYPSNLFCADFLGESNLVPGTVESCDGETIRVQTNFGTWQAVYRGTGQLAAGSRVTCLLRPEHIHPGEGNDSNCWQADIQSVRLNGATVTVTLEAADCTLRATLLNEHRSGLVPGAAGAWQVAAENTVVLTEGEPQCAIASAPG